MEMENLKFSFYAVLIGCAALAYFFHRIGNAAKNSKKPVMKFEVKFHKDAHPLGKTGTIWVDCPAKNMKSHPIDFVFVGLPGNPNLTPEVIAHIWEQAELAGYIPLALRSYMGLHWEGTPAQRQFMEENAKGFMAQPLKAPT